MSDYIYWAITLLFVVALIASEIRRLAVLAQIQECKDANEALLDTLNSRATVGNAARLIDIRRDNRFNYWTFYRNDQIFTIETMGLLSDNVAEWRTLAGLDQQ